MVVSNNKYFGKIDELRSCVRRIYEGYRSGFLDPDFVEAAYELSADLIGKSEKQRSPYRPFRATILGETDYLLLISNRFAGDKKPKQHSRLMKVVASEILQ